MGALRLMVADDREIDRKALCALVREQHGWEVVAEARDGREAVELAKQLTPEVAILNMGMPLLNGLDAVRQIAQIRGQTKILLLSTDHTDEFVGQALEAGVRGYLLKSDAACALVSAVRALHDGETFLPPNIAQVVTSGCSGEKKTAGVARKKLLLTKREKEVTQLVAKGLCSKDVAIALGISVKTVETHRTNIMRTIDCNNVVGLVRYALRNHMIEV